jgi:predicted RNA-binding Zn-ribbon protein involved in translation (DUF1610 family)
VNPDGYIQQLEEKIQILLALNEKLLQENEELKNRLHYYENPHTPPSENTLKKQEKDSLEPDPLPKKRGAPNGHKGATRPRKQPIEIKDVINHKCEKCGSENIQKQEKCVEKVIEDLQPPPKPKIIQYNLREVKCLDCGHQSISKDRDCPQKGNFAIFIIVYIKTYSTGDYLGIFC